METHAWILYATTIVKFHTVEFKWNLLHELYRRHRASILAFYCF